MAAVARERRVDLEAVELALRTAVLECGARVLEQLLETVGVGRRTAPVQCSCGARMKSQGLRSKVLLTIRGRVRFSRSMFQCPRCGKTRYPGDEILDVADTTRSPGVRRMIAFTAGDATFKKSCKQLKALAGITISAKDVERVAEAIGQDMEQWAQRERDHLRWSPPPPPETQKTIPTLYIEYDGTGVPMVKQALEGRKGKQPDGSAKTREAKLGCVFTQTAMDDEGRPVRDPASTSFVGAIEPVAPFGRRIYCEAVRRGFFKAKRVVVLGDGAEWIRTTAEDNFPNAVQIMDLYHAREHVSNLAKLLFERDLKRLNQSRDRWWDYLDDGDINAVVDDARAALPRDEQARKEPLREMAYLEKNKERMRYRQFRDQGLFIGSGVVEAGCGTLIGQRMKQSGMEWSLGGANAIIALRCIDASNRFEEYWEDRAA